MALGQDLAFQLKAADVVYLIGDLGAGKSTLARALIRRLTHEAQDVPSPSFSLMEIYEAAEFNILHVDLYRLKSPEEIYEIGLFELAAEAVSLIEWPQHLEHLGFDEFIEIRLETTPDYRLAHIRKHNGRY